MTTTENPLEKISSPSSATLSDLYPDDEREGRTIAFFPFVIISAKRPEDKQ